METALYAIAQNVGDLSEPRARVLNGCHSGITPPDADRMAADTLAEDGLPRFVWADIPVVDRDYVRVVMASVHEAHRWRAEYEHAKQLVAARASPSAA